MTILKVMCGVPASGKSSYIQQHVAANDLVASRDEVRFSLLSPGDEYFSKEKEVFREFCRRINEGAGKYGAVWVDATHLSGASRWKLLYNIDVKRFDKIVFIAIETPIDECLRRNALRPGRSHVPEQQLKNMAQAYRRPSYKDFLSLPNVEIEVVKYE